MTHHMFVLISLLLVVTAACSPSLPPVANPSPYKLSGPLVSSATNMMTAWYVPKNPLTDRSLDNSKLSQDIKWGFRLFTNTPHEAPQYAPSKMSCNNCHLNAGQRDRSLPLVGVAGMFPEYNRRSGRLYTLNDRIVDCFLRSENATGNIEAGGGQRASDDELETVPSPASKEVLALAAYITWLARGSEVGKNPAWRGQNVITASNVIPVEKLDPHKGEAIFMERCTNCHGTDGQGVAVGDK